MWMDCLLILEVEPLIYYVYTKIVACLWLLLNNSRFVDMLHNESNIEGIGEFSEEDSPTVCDSRKLSLKKAKSGESGIFL